MSFLWCWREFALLCVIFLKCFEWNILIYSKHFNTFFNVLIHFQLVGEFLYNFNGLWSNLSAQLLKTGGWFPQFWSGKHTKLGFTSKFSPKPRGGKKRIIFLALLLPTSHYQFIQRDHISKKIINVKSYLPKKSILPLGHRISYNHWKQHTVAESLLIGASHS